MWKHQLGKKRHMQPMPGLLCLHLFHGSPISFVRFLNRQRSQAVVLENSVQVVVAGSMNALAVTHDTMIEEAEIETEVLFVVVRLFPSLFFIVNTDRSPDRGGRDRDRDRGHDGQRDRADERDRDRGRDRSDYRSERRRDGY